MVNRQFELTGITQQDWTTKLETEGLPLESAYIPIVFKISDCSNVNFANMVNGEIKDSAWFFVQKNSTAGQVLTVGTITDVFGTPSDPACTILEWESKSGTLDGGI